jgi:hypothetical protein
MTRLAATAALALLSALIGGFLINVFNDDAHPQGWIPVVGYLVLALLLVFVAAVTIWTRSHCPQDAPGRTASSLAPRTAAWASVLSPELGCDTGRQVFAKPCLADF